ncbi:MAG: heparinase II/III domain-containing protein, partial [Candidatus Zixiibacteriota bacterium]
TVTDDIVLVSALHDGYSRRGKGIVHRRTVEVSLKNLHISVLDEITGHDAVEHLIESKLLTPWSCTPDKYGFSALIESDRGESLAIAFSSDKSLYLQARPIEYYPRFGQTSTGTQICCKCRTKLPFKLETRFVPYDADSFQSYDSLMRFYDSQSKQKETQGT